MEREKKVGKGGRYDSEIDEMREKGMNRKKRGKQKR